MKTLKKQMISLYELHEELLGTLHECNERIKVLESVSHASQNRAPSTEKIKGLVDADLSPMAKVSKIMLRVSGNMAEIIIVHGYRGASEVLVAAWPYIVRLEDHLPDINFEYIYIDAEQFDGKFYPDFTDVRA